MTKKLRICSYAPNIMKRIKFRGEGQKIRHACERREVRKKELFERRGEKILREKCGG